MPSYGTILWMNLKKYNVWHFVSHNSRRWLNDLREKIDVENEQ